MKLFSSRTAQDNGEWSVLALIELVIVCGIAFWLASSYRRTEHLALGATIAPLLLLRTKTSELVSGVLFDLLAMMFRMSVTMPFAAASDWCYAIKERSRKTAASSTPESWQDGSLSNRAFGLIISLVCVPFILAAALSARIVGTIVGTVRHPIETLSAIPSNWWKVVGCSDPTVEPELVPGLEEIDYSDVAMKYDGGSIIVDLTNEWRASKLLKKEALGYEDRPAARVLMLVVIHISSAVYRWSLKSTAPVYLPLLWIIRPVGWRSTCVHKRIRQTLLFDATKLAVAYSLFVLAVLTAKLFLMTAWHNWHIWHQQEHLARLIASFIEPKFFPIWQLCAMANAGLMIGGWLLMRFVDHRSTLGLNVNDRLISGILIGLAVVRRCLTIYILACSIYLLVQTSLVFDLKLPPLDNRLFPWTA